MPLEKEYNNMKISFYHLTKAPLERALPQLLDKILSNDKRAILFFDDEDKMLELDKKLWTLGKNSFLPHGTQNDPRKDEQLIYLTMEEENPCNAQFLVNLSGVVPKFMADFDRYMDMFDGNDDAELTAARTRWKQLSAQGHKPVYYQQNENGGWQTK